MLFVINSSVVTVTCYCVYFILVVVSRDPCVCIYCIAVVVESEKSFLANRYFVELPHNW